MRAVIQRIVIPDSPSNVSGLKASRIERLSEIAIFAGPNGGGKSRLLMLLGEKSIDAEQTKAYLAERKRLEPASRNDNPSIRQAALNRLAEIDITALIRIEVAQNLTTKPKFLYFSPNVRTFEDPNQLTFGQTAMFLAQGGRIENIPSNFTHTLLTIQSLVSNYLISRSPESEIQHSEVMELKRQFEGLRELVRTLLGMEIKWASGQRISMGGVPLDQINRYFSQGQKWLLHFAVSAYSEIALDDPIVLCLDEPELHLHPSALNQIIDVLKQTLRGGQILVATHSIPLIAHVGYENTWLVSEGKITYAGRQPEMVINGLLGGIDAVRKMSDLLLEPDATATARFALESLSSPSVSASRNDDPQGSQIVAGIRAKQQELGRPVRILDYGAGKGRILDLADYMLGAELTSLLDYTAFDPSTQYAETCEGSIARVYGSAEARYFSKKSSIPELLAGKKMDVVVLCNVIHEISPLDWRDEFSFIARLLDDGGEALVVEDQLLPHGEHAHTEGFVIASKEALRILFSIDPSEASELREIHPTNSKYSERLMCIGIPALLLHRISRESVTKSLHYIVEHASRRIQEIRGLGKSSYSEGLQHALHLHQFANSTFALKKLS